MRRLDPNWRGWCCRDELDCRGRGSDAFGSVRIEDGERVRWWGIAQMVASSEDERQVKKGQSERVQVKTKFSTPHNAHFFDTAPLSERLQKFPRLISNLTHFDPLLDGTLFPHISFIPDLLDPLQLSALYT